MPSSNTGASLSRRWIDTEAIDKALQVCGNAPDGFLARYNPARQNELATMGERAFACYAPSVATAALAWGDQQARLWLSIQLRDLSEFVGARDKMTPAQMDWLATTIMAEWGWLKTTELMLFFHRLKTGAYGRFYGVVDPQLICEALREFIDERAPIVGRIEASRRAAAAEADRANRATREEYLEACRQAGVDPDHWQSTLPTV